MSAQRGRTGFTLVELMVAVATIGVVIIYTLGTFTYQHQTYVVVDQVSEAQQNTRAIAALIERDIRNSGYLIPPEATTCGLDATAGPDSLFVSDADAVLPADELPASLAGDELSAAVTGIAGSVVSVDDVVIDGTATYDTNADGTDDSDFRVNAGAILVDLANPDRGAGCGTVTAVDFTAPMSVTVNFAVALGGAAALPAQLALVPAHVYAISAGPPPELRRDGQLLAKDVEDLQVAWFYDDVTPNGQVDANEYRGDGVAPAYTPVGLDSNTLRELRINLVTRTRNEDPRQNFQQGRQQATENRATATTADGRRRRVHTAVVRIRNIQS